MQDMHTTRPERVTSSTSGQLSLLSFFVMPSFQKENLNYIATIWLDASMSMLASDHAKSPSLEYQNIRQDTRTFGK